MNSNKRVLALALALAMSIPTATLAQSSKELSAEKNKKMNERSELNTQMNAQKQNINRAETEKKAVTGEIDTLDGKIAGTSAKIGKLEKEIDRLNVDIANNEQKLNEAKLNLQENIDMFRLRIREMYKKGNVEYLQVILNSRDIEELLRNNQVVSSIAEADRELIEYIKQQIKTIEEVERSLKEDRAKVETNRISLESEKASYEAAVEAKNAYMKELESNIDLYSKEYEKAEASWANLDKEIARLQKEIQTQKQKELARSMPKRTNVSVDSAPRSGANYTWPVPGYYGISSPYGYRTHPILGYRKFHSGVDIPAPTGTPVVAAKSGVVIMATCMSGYGNVVMIDHGDTVTVYAHNSAFNVSAGQQVSAGDVVCFIGSTGLSTGPHLHFEVRVNGSTVNPLGYI
ncbi:murein DD-endopeptidase MepM/ murein hydrolase activator NlpD [Peptoniphilus olsenii]|uniref:Murein DD-endopeptidase MepM/ murein hydrolase activator NlpD n=1 Tax=Peptoniphilus olsenii TaxID=411570 RepID=A0ABV2J913_9FIRM